MRRMALLACKRLIWAALSASAMNFALSSPAAAIAQDDQADTCTLLAVSVRPTAKNIRDIKKTPFPKPYQNLFADPCHSQAAIWGLVQFHIKYGSADTAKRAMKSLEKKALERSTIPANPSDIAQGFEDKWNLAHRDVEKLFEVDNVSTDDVWRSLRGPERPQSLRILGKAWSDGRKLANLGFMYLELAEFFRDPILFNRGKSLFTPLLEMRQAAKRAGRGDLATSYLQRQFGDDYKLLDLRLAFLDMDIYPAREKLKSFDAVAKASFDPDFLRYAKRKPGDCETAAFKNDQGETICVIELQTGAPTYYYYVGRANRIFNRRYWFLRGKKDRPDFTKQPVFVRSFLFDQDPPYDGKFPTLFVDYEIADVELRFEVEREDCQEREEDGEEKDGKFDSILAEFPDLARIVDPVTQPGRYSKLARLHADGIKWSKRCDEDPIEIDLEHGQLKRLFAAHLKRPY